MTCEAADAAVPVQFNKRAERASTSTSCLVLNESAYFRLRCKRELSVAAAALT